MSSCLEFGGARLLRMLVFGGTIGVGTRWERTGHGDGGSMPRGEVADVLRGLGWRHNVFRKEKMGPAVSNWDADIEGTRNIGLQIAGLYADVHGKELRGEWKPRCDGTGRGAERKQRSRVGVLAHFEMVTGVDSHVKYVAPGAVVPFAGIDRAKGIHDGARYTGGDVVSTESTDTGEATGDVAQPHATSTESDGCFHREAVEVISKRLYRTKNGPHPLDASMGEAIGIVRPAGVAIKVRSRRLARRTTGMLPITAVGLLKAVEKGPDPPVRPRRPGNECAGRGGGNGSIAAPVREAQRGDVRVKSRIRNIRWRSESP